MTFFLFALAFFLLAGNSFGEGPKLGDLSVTKVWNYGEDGLPRSVCTAFYVDSLDGEPWIVSNAHCMSGYLVGRSGEPEAIFGVITWRASILTRDKSGKSADIALGSVRWPGPPPAVPVKRLAVRSPAAGSSVYIHGFPLGDEAVAKGVVWAVVSDRIEVMASCGQVNFGSSGSPVENELGEVIGVVYGVQRCNSGQTSTIAAATAVESVRDLISSFSEFLK